MTGREVDIGIIATYRPKHSRVATTVFLKLAGTCISVNNFALYVYSLFYETYLDDGNRVSYPYCTGLLQCSINVKEQIPARSVAMQTVFNITEIFIRNLRTIYPEATCPTIAPGTLTAPAILHRQCSIMYRFSKGFGRRLC